MLTGLVLAQGTLAEQTARLCRVDKLHDGLLLLGFACLNPHAGCAFQQIFTNDKTKSNFENLVD